MNKNKLLWLLGITLLVGAFFRLYHIGVLPGGLFPDEAANGLDINLMESGRLQPFYERGNGREALFFYLLWAGVKLFGRTPFAHHFVVALVGIAALAMCYLVTRKLFALAETVTSPVIARSESLGERRGNPKPKTTKPEIATSQSLLAMTRPGIIALLATFLMATSTWHIVLSRTAFRANMVPLCAALTLWAMLGIYFAKTRKWEYIWSALFGATLALGLYTYIAYRIMIPFVGLLILWPLLAALKTQGLRAVAKKYVPLLVVSVISFLIVLAPLGRYFYQNPDWLVGRSGQVSVFSPDWNHGDLVGTILETSRLSMLAYFTDGDLNWRHNISGFPFLSPIVSPFFALGLLLMLYGAIRYFFAPVKQAHRYPHYLLIGWFLSFLVPVVTTAEGIPHGLRAIGTIPAVFIVTAYGLYWVSSKVWHMVTTYPHGSPRMEAALQFSLKALVVCFAIGLPLQAYAGYFIYAANNAENYYAFRSDLTVVSEYLKQNGNRDDTYLVVDKFSLQTVDYFTTVDGARYCDREAYFRPRNCVSNPRNQPYVQVDPEESWQSPTAMKDGRPIWQNGVEPGMQVIFAQSSIFDIKKFKAAYPNARLEREERNKFGQAVLAVYRIQ